MLNLSVDQIGSLAPDAASASAAKGLANPAKWQNLGISEAALWGECQGSGSKPYQVQIDAAGPTFKCSCPSRKFPCKHGLALLLIRAQKPGAVPVAEPPAWVSEWLAAREKRTLQKEEKVAKKAKGEVDPKAEIQARKKLEKRWALMSSGIQELETWLSDQVRRGYAAMTAGGIDAQSMAARLVDAQMPTLARRVKGLGVLLTASQPDIPGRLLGEMGRLQLLLDGLKRYADLPPGMQGDLRAAVGWNYEKEEILALAAPVEDCWGILGIRIEPREKLWERRVWLHGRDTGRRAVVVDYAHGTPVFASPFVVGEAYRLSLAFYPSAARCGRALVAGGEPNQPETLTVPKVSLHEEIARLTTDFSHHPWSEIQPLWVRGATLARAESGWCVRTAEGVSLPVCLGNSDDIAWNLMSLSGGAALDWFGEWDGEGLQMLSAWRERVLWNTAGQAG